MRTIQILGPATSCLFGVKQTLTNLLAKGLITLLVGALVPTVVVGDDVPKGLQPVSYEPAAVEAVQEGLADLGYDVAASGEWDGQTKEAVSLYLRRIGVAGTAAVWGEGLPLITDLLTISAQKQNGDYKYVQSALSADAFDPSYPVPSLIAPDGTALIISGTSVTQFDLTTGLPIGNVSDNGYVPSNVAVSDDGKFVARSDSQDVFIEDLQSHRLMAHMSLEADGDTRKVTVLRFGRDSDTLYIGDDNGQVSKFAVSSGKETVFGTHVPAGTDPSIFGAVASLAVSNDGSKVASIAAYDGKVRVWAAGDGSALAVIDVFPANPEGNDFDNAIQDAVAAIIFNGDGSRIRAARRPFAAYDVRSPTVVDIEWQSGTVDASVVAIDSVPVTNQSNVMEYRVFDSSDLHIVAADANGGYLEKIASYQAFPDFHVLAVGPGNDGVLLSTEDAIYYSRIDGAPPQKLGTFFAHPLQAFDFSADGRTVYLGVTSAGLESLDLGTGEVTSLSLTTSASEGEVEGNVNDWFQYGLARTDHQRMLDTFYADMPAEDEDEGRPHEIRWLSLADGSAGRIAVTASAAGFERVRGVTLSPDGGVAASTYQKAAGGGAAEAIVSLIDTSTGEESQRYKLQPKTKYKIGYQCIQMGECARTLNKTAFGYVLATAGLLFSDSGRYVYAGYYEPALAIIDRNAGKLARVVDTFVAPEDFGLINIGPGMDKKGGWTPEFATAMAAEASIPVDLAAIPGSDDLFVTLGGFGNTAYVLRVGPGSKTPLLRIPVPLLPKGVIVSPDGKTLAVAYGAAIAIFDATEGTFVSAFATGINDFWSAGFTGDGQRLLTSGSEDGGLRVWDWRSGQLLTTTYVANDGNWVTVTPEGFYTSSPAFDGDVGISYGPSKAFGPAEVSQFFAKPELVAAKLAGGQDETILEASVAADAARTTTPKQPALEANSTSNELVSTPARELVGTPLGNEQCAQLLTQVKGLKQSGLDTTALETQLLQMGCAATPVYSAEQCSALNDVERRLKALKQDTSALEDEIAVSCMP